MIYMVTLHDFHGVFSTVTDKEHLTWYFYKIPHSVLHRVISAVIGMEYLAVSSSAGK